MRTEGQERRREPRVRVSQRLRIRIPDTGHPAEICTTHNVSKSGVYFVTPSTHYLPNMNVNVIRNFDPDDQVSVEEIGKIVRVDSLGGYQKGVAIRILVAQ
jgi:hypothetical protein